jgi:hypothetical protein
MRLRACPRPQVKATVLLMPNGSDRVTVAPEQPAETDKKVEDAELLKLLNTGGWLGGWVGGWLAGWVGC